MKVARLAAPAAAPDIAEGAGKVAAMVDVLHRNLTADDLHRHGEELLDRIVASSSAVPRNLPA